MELKLSNYIKYSEPLNQDEGPQGKRIVLTTRKSMAITITNFVVDLMKESNFTVLPNHLFNVLMFHEMVIPSDQEETEEILKLKGILGDDISDINARIFVDLNMLNQNDLKSYLDNAIEKANITTKVKTITVELNGSLKGFNFDESELDDIKKHIDDQESLSKFNITYRLICGIPEEKSLTNADLSWIDNIQIIFFSNESTTDFIDSINRLKSFSESVKLKNKINSRVILPFNYFDQIVKSHELIKSIEFCIFQYTLRKNSFKKLDDWSKEELRLLNTVDEHGMHSINFSEVATHFLDESFRFRNGYHYEHFEDFVIEANGVGVKKIGKKVLTSEKVRALKEKSPQCYECIFLSMCGGIMNKNADHNMDCPDLRSNIMVKSSMKYKI